MNFRILTFIHSIILIMIIFLVLLNANIIDTCKIKYKSLPDYIFPYYSILVSATLQNWPSCETNCCCLLLNEIYFPICTNMEHHVFLFLKYTDQAAKYAKVRRITTCTFKRGCRIFQRKDKWESSELWNKAIFMFTVWIIKW